MKLDPETEIAEQTEQGYRQLPTSLVMNLVNSLILCSLLWGAIDSAAIIVWFSAVALVTAGRYALVRSYRRAGHTGNAEGGRWTRYFKIAAFASGMVWGLAGIVLFCPYSLPHQVFLSFVIGGMVAGALPFLSAVKGSFASFSIPALAPVTAQMLLQGDQIHLVMGLMCAIFGAAMLSSSRQIHQVISESVDLRHKLSASIENGNQLEQMVMLDALTGIANRRLFDEELTREWERAARNHTALSIALADIDYFKVYNDTYGHRAGDRCLILISEAMEGVLQRPSDLAARIGGEEFAFLLPRTSTKGAAKIAESIRRAVAEQSIEHEGSQVAGHVTVSLGVATVFPATVSDPSSSFDAADRALYEAKRGGRDRIVTSPTLLQGNPELCLEASR